MKYLIVFLPMIFFSMAFITILVLVKKNGINNLLKETIVSDDPKTEPVDKTSTSRFVLMLSGLTAVIIGIGMVTYFLYASLWGLPIKVVDMESITKIVLALGVGVVPYGFNQLKNLFR